MASPVTDAQREEYRKAFDKADKDSSGKIDAKEFLHLVEVLEKKYLPHLLPEFGDVDKDANKKIDFDEFVVMMEKLRPAKLTESEQQMAMDEFKKLDKDGNGLITLDEMVQALSFAYTEEELKKKIADVDKDADGKMNYKEFLAMLY
ncbi:uncharacterized protein [Diadema setosum]|uniref:uncharacterized protein n=1 Tax=Diadema setosum TaxID=31175 RepID=UPI003B3AF076